LRHFELAYELTTGDEQRILLLENLARNALEAEEILKAKDYAIRLIEGAAICANGTQVWFAGNAIH